MLMAGQFPSINDRDFNLWFKIAWNFYNYALRLGATGLNPPSLNDRHFDLIKKITFYTAKSVELHP